MVISRNDIKRRRKDSDTTVDTLPDSPKRTKVHAQRKFAQGSNVSSPVITPVKEIEKEKVKDVIPVTTELLPIARPNTEDFLTFLCFRGTPILPPTLDFFNTANTVKTSTEPAKESKNASEKGSNESQEQNSERPFIAFGVRKRADPFVSTKLEKKRRHALALQTLRRKYQEQRMAKIRAVTIEKMSQGIKIKSKNLVRTRSVTKREADTTTTKSTKIKVVSKHVKITARTVKRPILKQKMCLRSRGRFIPRELATPVKPKIKRPIIKKKIVPQKKEESSSEFSSDDNQPLVKAVRKNPKLVPVPAPKLVKKVAVVSPKKEAVRVTRSTPTSKQDSPITQRPSRKTKEAASLYMNLLGPKLVTDPTVDDDDASIDSFPELPNVRRTEQREIEMKAKVTTNSRMSTRKSTEINKKTEKTKTKILHKVKPKVVKKESDDSDSSEKPSKKEPKKELRSKKITPKPTAKVVAVTKGNVEQSFSDSDEEPLVKLTTKKKPVPLKKEITKTVEKRTVTKKNIETVNATKTRTNITKPEPKTFTPVCLSDDDEEKAFRGFVKSEDVNTHSQSILQQSICLHSETKIPTSADLLCKDVGRRFGKGKVNMSTEQIEKWLKDSALAGECNKKELYEKKYDEDLVKYEEKEEAKLEKKVKPNIISEKYNIDLEFPAVKQEKDEDMVKIKEEKKEKAPLVSEQKTKAPATVTSSNTKLEKTPITNERKCIFQQRRSILNKDRKDTQPNLKAFSPNNESSVYAFEADFEMPVNTPFRSQIRRPSSTATSRSEDDSSKFEEEDKKKQQFSKFRLPAVVKPPVNKNHGKQEVSLTLSADEANNSASIAVQVNLDSVATFTDNNVSMECSTQTDTGDEDGDGHLFYIPLQPGKQTNTNQLIQGVTVKLGTEGLSGANQRVVMRAKLVTQTPDNRLPILGQPKPLAQSAHMCPPVGTVQPTYRPKHSDIQKTKPIVDHKLTTDTSTECKISVPSSPSASSSSSAKIYKRTSKPRARLLDVCQPVNSSEFPSLGSPGQLVEALTFHPTEREFQDPIEFIEKIRPLAEKFGICRIIPPANFKPECKVADDMRFTAYNQYVHKMLHRWGPNFKEFMAIKKYLATQSINFTHPPWIGGMEIDLPRLYQTVQSLGGLKEVIEKKRWPKVAEGMKIPKSAQDRVTKLDDIYCKYLLPYDTLSPAEREKLFDEIETDWAKHESRILSRSQANQVMNSNDGSDSDSDDDAEECITKGRNMALNAFYRIARNTMSMWFRTPEPSATDVEQEFWKHVSSRQNHLCVHSGSIDSSGWGYGFVCNKNSPFARHPWNLKILTNNSGSVLRSLGPIMGVTVPTLHVGMVFSACCWYRDPHGLPWIEYLHTGANKIWYGIPDSFSDPFRAALTKLVPSYIRDKTLWLSSDTAMVPPNLLTQNGVSLCRTVQEPGQFIVVFPKAFTSSICSGYVVSESVYFAPSNWLLTARQVFRDIRDSCEPAMFSWERLLLNIASDSRANLEVLKQIIPDIQSLREHEAIMRKKLESLGLTLTEQLPLPDVSHGRRKRKMQDDDGEYECEICRTNLYVSLVTNSHEEGVYCLVHAVEHIEKKPTQLKYCKLMYTYDIKELDSLIEKIKTSIEFKSYRRLPSKYAGMATLLK